MAFTTSVARVHAAGEGEVGLDVAVDHRDPVQAEQQFVGVAEDQVGHHFQGFEIEIRLIEAVEEHQAIGAGRIQPSWPCWPWS